MIELKNKTINTIIDNLLEKTLSGKINWERSDTINYRNGVYYWKWETEKYGMISINASRTSNKENPITYGEVIIYFDIFNVNGVHIIENQYLVSGNSNVVKLYDYLQKEYDKKGAELLEKLLEELNNL